MLKTDLYKEAIQVSVILGTFRMLKKFLRCALVINHDSPLKIFSAFGGEQKRNNDDNNNNNSNVT